MFLSSSSSSSPSHYLHHHHQQQQQQQLNDDPTTTTTAVTDLNLFASPSSSASASAAVESAAATMGDANSSFPLSSSPPSSTSGAFVADVSASSSSSSSTSFSFPFLTSSSATAVVPPVSSSSASNSAAASPAPLHNLALSSAHLSSSSSSSFFFNATPPLSPLAASASAANATGTAFGHQTAHPFASSLTNSSSVGLAASRALRRGSLPNTSTSAATAYFTPYSSAAVGNLGLHSHNINNVGVCGGYDIFSGVNSSRITHQSAAAAYASSHAHVHSHQHVHSAHQYQPLSCQSQYHHHQQHQHFLLGASGLGFSSSSRGGSRANSRPGSQPGSGFQSPVHAGSSSFGISNPLLSDNSHLGWMLGCPLSRGSSLGAAGAVSMAAAAAAASTGLASSGVVEGPALTRSSSLQLQLDSSFTVPIAGALPSAFGLPSSRNSTGEWARNTMDCSYSQESANLFSIFPPPPSMTHQQHLQNQHAMPLSHHQHQSLLPRDPNDTSTDSSIARRSSSSSCSSNSGEHRHMSDADASNIHSAFASHCSTPHRASPSLPAALSVLLAQANTSNNTQLQTKLEALYLTGKRPPAIMRAPVSTSSQSQCQMVKDSACQAVASEHVHPSVSQLGASSSGIDVESVYHAAAQATSVSDTRSLAFGSGADDGVKHESMSNDGHVHHESSDSVHGDDAEMKDDDSDYKPEEEHMQGSAGRKSRRGVTTAIVIASTVTGSSALPSLSQLDCKPPPQSKSRPSRKKRTPLPDEFKCEYCAKTFTQKSVNVSHTEKVMMHLQ